MHKGSKEPATEPTKLCAAYRAFDAVLRAMGRTAIRQLETVEEGKYLKARFRGIRRPLYWPASLETGRLFSIALELTFPLHWHYYEVPETRVLPQDVVLDCGAAEGLFALRVVERCRAVVLVEPLPLFVDCLRKTFRGEQKARVVAAALADHCGRVSLEENGTSSRVVERGGDLSVEAITVDELCSRLDLVPTYIKADLEGFEPAMIRGARETLRRHRPRLAVTTYDRADTAAEVTSLLRSCNPAYRIRTKGMMPGSGAPFLLHAW